MKSMKKILAILLAVMLMVPSMAVFAAESASAKDLSKATISTSSFTYNGKKKTVKVTVKLNGKTLSSKNYSVSGTKSATRAGKYTVKVTGKGAYTGSKSATWTIAKKANPAVNKTVSVKRGKSIRVAQKAGAGKATVVSVSSSNITVKRSSGNGITITAKKGAKKGTYKVTVKYAGDNNDVSATKTITVKVK